MFRVIIAGSRFFNNYNFLKRKCEKILENKKKVTILSGGCRGTDKLGEDFAKEKGYDLEVYLAEWNIHGKAAGPIRNTEMVDKADALIAFVGKGSVGTKDVIKKAKNKGLLIREIKIQ